MDRIGKYEVIEELGRGGMGAVYRARDSVIGRDVAIKVILDRAMDAPEIRKRFYREARSAGALTHDNVTTIYDVGEEDGHPYLVMELLDGIDLRHVLDTRPLPPLDQRLDIAIQICRGLGYAHSRSIIHRDVKPENIRITSTGRVKILDFGIARIGSEAQTLTLTQASIGTPRYMSPEQVQGHNMDHRTDIFSFGVLLYELLTGTSPFTADHLTAVLIKIIRHDPKPPALPGFPQARVLQRIVAKCLAKSPDDRYRSLAEVAEALQQVRAAAARPPGRPKFLNWFGRSASAANVAPEQAAHDPDATRLAGLPTGASSDLPDLTLTRFGGTGGLGDASGSPPRGTAAASPIPVGREQGEETIGVPSGATPPAVEAGIAWPAAPDPVASPHVQPSFGGSATARRKRMLMLAVAVVIPVIGTALYFGLSGPGEVAAPEPAALAASDSTTVAAVSPLAPAAERVVREMHAQRDSAEAAGVDASPLFQQAVALQQESERLLGGSTTGDLQRAVEAAEAAIVLFNDARLGATSDDAERQQLAQQAEQRARAARQSASPYRRAAEARAAFDGAERTFAAGVRARTEGDYAEAARLFGEAGRGFRDARAAAETAAHRAAETQTQPTAEIAPPSASPQETESAAEAALRTAALRAREAARGALAQAQRATGPQAETLRRQGQAKFDEGEAQVQATNHAAAEAAFQEASTLWKQAAAQTAPPAPNREATLPAALSTLAAQLERGMQTENTGLLRQVHAFYGSFDALFGVVEAIEASVETTEADVNGEQATTEATLRLSYVNPTQENRPTIRQTVRYRWTLAWVDGNWRLTGVQALRN